MPQKKVSLPKCKTKMLQKSLLKLICEKNNATKMQFVSLFFLFVSFAFLKHSKLEMFFQKQDLKGETSLATSNKLKQGIP